MPSVKIAPSILSADFSKLGNEIQDLEKAKADLIHIDVMDGHFVPNITIGPEVIKKLRKHTSLPFDVHLMISPVDNFITSFADAGEPADTLARAREHKGLRAANKGGGEGKKQEK